MIRAVLSTGNRKMLVLGLSAENVNRLKIGQPITVDLQALEQGAGKVRIQDIVLMAGATEESITAAIAEAMGISWDEAVAGGRVMGI